MASRHTLAVLFASHAGSRVLAGVLAAAMAVPTAALADPSKPLQLAANGASQSRSAEPDVFDRIGQWFDRLGTQTREALRDAGDKAGSIGALPDIHIVAKRVPCPPAANGAPNCRKAAETVCRSNGYASGKSFETRSEEKCSLAAILARRAGQPNTCSNETYLVRSVCQ